MEWRLLSTGRISSPPRSLSPALKARPLIGPGPPGHLGQSPFLSHLIMDVNHIYKTPPPQHVDERLFDDLGTGGPLQLMITEPKAVRSSGADRRPHS